MSEVVDVSQIASWILDCAHDYDRQRLGGLTGEVSSPYHLEGHKVWFLDNSRIPTIIFSSQRLHETTLLQIVIKVMEDPHESWWVDTDAVSWSCNFGNMWEVPPLMHQVVPDVQNFELAEEVYFILQLTNWAS